MPKNVFAGVGTARGDKRDSANVGTKAVEMAIENMKKQGGKIPGSIGFLFCSPKYDVEKLVEAAHEAFNGTEWVGCTTSGELSSHGFSQGGCVAAIIQSEYLKFSVAVDTNMFKNPKKSGEDTVKEALENLKIDKHMDSYIHFLAMKKKSPTELVKLNPFGIISITAGLTGKRFCADADLLQGVKKVIGNKVIVGGAAADDAMLIANYQFHNGKVYEKAFIATSFLSDLKFSLNTAHGFKPTGKMGMITKVSKDGHTILEINNKPAADVVEKWLDVSKEKLNTDIMSPTGFKIKRINLMAQKHPFAIADGFGNYWLKVPLSISKEDGINFAPGFQKNTVIHMMEGKKKDVLNAAKDFCNSTLKEIDKEDISFSLIFDCSLRWFILQEKALDEVKIFQRNLKDFVGFYTYGEHCSSSGTPALHNQTLTGITFSNKLLTE